MAVKFIKIVIGVYQMHPVVFGMKLILIMSVVLEMTGDFCILMMDCCL